MVDKAWRGVTEKRAATDPAGHLLASALCVILTKNEQRAKTK